jgi:hypothetical protein
MALRSIRVRLMLWYVAVLAVILVLFAVAVYVTMRRSLYEQLDDTLENRAFLTSELISFDDAGAPQLDVADGSPNPDADDNFQRLIALDGAVLFDSSQAFGDVPIQPAAIDATRRGDTHWSTLDSGGEEARVLSAPVIDGDGDVVALMQVGEATDDVEETLRNLLAILAFAAPAALVLAGIGGWWISSRALAPIDRVTRAARDISDGGDLSRRTSGGCSRSRARACTPSTPPSTEDWISTTPYSGARPASSRRP